MSLEQSKWIQPTTDEVGNPWREYEVSESNLIDALTYTLSNLKVLKRTEIIERLLVGEPVNGVYPLSVAIIKKGDK